MKKLNKWVETYFPDTVKVNLWYNAIKPFFMYMLICCKGYKDQSYFTMRIWVIRITLDFIFIIPLLTAISTIKIGIFFLFLTPITINLTIIFCCSVLRAREKA